MNGLSSNCVVTLYVKINWKMCQNRSTGFQQELTEFMILLKESAFAATFAIEHLNILKLKFPRVQYGCEKKKYHQT